MIVGCDKQMEWMLPWWWQHYVRHNTFPVAFVDMGNDRRRTRIGCAKSGELWTCPVCMSLSALKKRFPKILPRNGSDLSRRCVGSARSWYPQTVCMAKTPFEKTIWVDLDCEVVGSLKPLFSKIHPYSGMALAREVFQGDNVYNRALWPIAADSLLLQQWMDAMHSLQSRLFERSRCAKLYHRKR